MSNIREDLSFISTVKGINQLKNVSDDMLAKVERIRLTFNKERKDGYIEKLRRSAGEKYSKLGIPSLDILEVISLLVNYLYEETMPEPEQELAKKVMNKLFEVVKKSKKLEGEYDEDKLMLEWEEIGKREMTRRLNKISEVSNPMGTVATIVCASIITLNDICLVKVIKDFISEKGIENYLGLVSKGDDVKAMIKRILTISEERNCGNREIIELMEAYDDI